MPATVVLIGVLMTVAGLSLDGLSVARRWPSISRRSRANDTPVLDHVKGGGPYGGAVSSLAVARTHPRMTLLALRGGGVYSTVDRGETWQPADRGLPPNHGCELVADPVHGETLYSVCGDGLFKTVDAGQLWRQLDVDNPGLPVIAPADPRVLYDGPLRSHDGGARWSHVTLRHRAPHCDGGSIIVDVGKAALLFCVSDEALISSRNGGERWTRMPSPDGLQLSAVSAAVGQPDRLLASTSDGQLYAVSTRGSGWTRLGTFPDGRPADDVSFGDDGTMGYATQGDSLVRSGDGGRTWHVLPAAWPPFSLWTFAVDPLESDIVYVGTSVGPYVSEDGGRTWQLRTRGLTRAPSSVVIHEGARPSVFASTGAEVVRSDDGGATWSRVGGDIFSAGIDPRSLAADGAGGVLLRTGSRRLRLPAEATEWAEDAIPGDIQMTGRAAGRRGGLRLLESKSHFQYSRDGGTSWHTATLPSGVMPSDVVPLGDDPRQLLAAIGGMRALAARAHNSLWQSTDGGTTWLRAFDGGWGSASCCELLRSRRDADMLYAVRSGMVVGDGGSELLRSVDRGRTWTVGDIFEGAITLVPTRPDTLLAQSYHRGAVRSIDGGVTWTSSGAGLPTEAKVTGFAFDRQHPRTVFAATSNRGVYRSDDAGQSWTPTGHNIRP